MKITMTMTRIESLILMDKIHEMKASKRVPAAMKTLNVDMDTVEITPMGDDQVFVSFDLSFEKSHVDTYIQVISDAAMSMGSIAFSIINMLKHYVQYTQPTQRKDKNEEVA